MCAVAEFKPATDAEQKRHIYAEAIARYREMTKGDLVFECVREGVSVTAARNRARSELIRFLARRAVDPKVPFITGKAHR